MKNWLSKITVSLLILSLGSAALAADGALPFKYRGGMLTVLGEIEKTPSGDLRIRRPQVQIDGTSYYILSGRGAKEICTGLGYKYGAGSSSTYLGFIGYLARLVDLTRSQIQIVRESDTTYELSIRCSNSSDILNY